MKTKFLVLLATVTAAVVLAAETTSTSPRTLAAGDILSIQAPHVAGFGSRHLKVDENGALQLEMIGRVQASGKTISQLTTELEQRLADFVLEPDVQIEINDHRS